MLRDSSTSRKGGPLSRSETVSFLFSPSVPAGFWTTRATLRSTTCSGSAASLASGERRCFIEQDKPAFPLVVVLLSHGGKALF